MNKKLLILFSLCALLTGQISFGSYKNSFKKILTPQNLGKWTNKYFTWMPFVKMIGFLSLEKLKNPKFGLFEEDLKIGANLNKQAKEELLDAFVDPKKLFHENPTSPFNSEEAYVYDKNKIIIPQNYAKILNTQDDNTGKYCVLLNIMEKNIEQKNDYNTKIIERQPFYYALSVIALERLFKPVSLFKKTIFPIKKSKSFIRKTISYPWNITKGYFSAGIKNILATQPIRMEQQNNVYKTYDEMTHLNSKKLYSILELKQEINETIYKNHLKKIYKKQQSNSSLTIKKIVDCSFYLSSEPHPKKLNNIIQDKRNRLVK